MSGQDDRRTEREFELIHLSARVMKTLKPDAARHMFHGLMQRLFMLRAGRMHLLANADASDRTPRDVYLSTELSLQANAYYLNVRGALDNLAWSLHYQYDLIPSTNEKNGARQRVFLFGSQFLDALNNHLPRLVERMRADTAWSTDLSERRDPAAHRIPLQVPPTIYSQEDEIRRKEIEKEATRLMKAGRFNDGFSHFHKIGSLGQFEPVLVQATTDGPVIVNLHKQVASDHDQFLSLAEAIVKALALAQHVV